MENERIISNYINDTLSIVEENNKEYYFSLVELFINVLLGNSFYILILTLAIIIFRKLIEAIKEKYEELSLFNVEIMSEEERKTFFFTRKITNLNEKLSSKVDVIQSQANRSKLFIKVVSNEVYDRDYKYAMPIKKLKKEKPRNKIVFSTDKNVIYD